MNPESLPLLSPKNNCIISLTCPLISELGCISSLLNASIPPLASKKSLIEPSLSRAKALSYLKNLNSAKSIFWSKRFEVNLKDWMSLIIRIIRSRLRSLCWNYDFDELVHRFARVNIASEKISLFGAAYAILMISFRVWSLSNESKT